jgi:membrane protease YdiL (CAAX protease family)
MDVDLDLQTQRPTRDASGNAIWRPSGALAGVPSRSPAGSPIRFRHIALLLLGGVVAGSILGLVIGIPVYGFTDSKFVLGMVMGISVYGSLILGYHWLSREHDWGSIRARFSPVATKTLILSALGAIALIAFIAIVDWILRWAGIKIANVPSPIELESWTQLPLALFLIVIVAPVCEELLFRGLLLDWLRQKMNVWLAAAILSLVFSLLHNNPFSLGAVGWLAFAERFLLGLGASAVAIKYRSLRPSFALHATLNAIACIVSVYART